MTRRYARTSGRARAAGGQEGRDVDRASPGVVKMLDADEARDARARRYPEMPWEPKAAFDALADIYGRTPSTSA